MSWAAILATTISIVLCYLASKYQRWLLAPLPMFPALTSAVLAAVVGLSAWLQVLPPVTAILAWLASSIVIALVVLASGRLRRV